MKKSLVFFFLGMFGLIAACKHELPEFILDNGYVPDTTHTYPPPPENDSVCFNTQILPLITANCAQEGCHDAISHEEDLVLNNYNGIKALVKKGKLVKSITDPDTKDRMPYRLPPLDAASIELIKKWISEGALNRNCTPAICDTVNVKYTTHITPIVNTYCKGCHNVGNPKGSVNLDNYTDMKAQTLAGKVICTITANNCNLMPKGGVSIGTCNIRKIQIWAANNCPQ